MNTLVRRPAIALNVCDNDENACDGEIVGERKKKTADQCWQLSTLSA